MKTFMLILTTENNIVQPLFIPFWLVLVILKAENIKNYSIYNNLMLLRVELFGATLNV